jgi:hypothetical protein
MVISSSHGYTESHAVHVVAFDAAGNETESEKVRFYIVHEPEEEEEQPGATGAMWWQQEDLLATSWRWATSILWSPFILPAGRFPPWCEYG